MRNYVCVAALCLTWTVGSHFPMACGEEGEPKSYPVLSGVGLALSLKDGQIVVGKIVKKSPAEASGQIHEGDRIVSIQVDAKEVSLDGKTVGEAASYIRGPVGSTIVLSVKPLKGDKVILVTLERLPLEIEGKPGSSYSTFIGKPLAALTITALDGKPSEQVADYHGKVVVLDLWASWCPACYRNVGQLQKVATDNPTWKGRVELIAITVDSDLAKAAAVINEKKWTETKHGAADVAALKAIGVSVLPVLIIVAPDGTVAAMAGSDALDIEKEVAKLLEAKSKFAE